MILLVLLAVIPALGLILYTASAQRRSAATDAKENLLRLAQFAAANQEQANEGVRQLLMALSQLPEIRNGNTELCERLLANLLKQYRAYAGFGVIDTNGNLICSAPSTNKAINAADRSYFRFAKSTRAFAVGEYQIGRATKKASINFSYPLLDGDGKVKAVVFAAWDLAWLNKLAAKAQLPKGSVLTVSDRNGTVLVRYPDPQNWVGKPLADRNTIEFILQQKEGTNEARGLDGVERLYAFTGVSNASTSPDIFIRIGIPQDVAVAEADRLLALNLISLATVTILALVAAWVGGDLFLLRKVKSLVTTTEQLRQGEMSARTHLTYEPGELGQLARAFDEMAETLEIRERAIAKLNQDLQHRIDELQTLFEVIPIGILIARDLTFSNVQANPAFAQILGLSPNMNVSSTPPEGNPRPFYKILQNGKELTGDELPLRYAAVHGVPVEGKVVDAVREDGSVSHLFGYAAPLFDEQGKPRGSVAAFLDITKLQQTEAALKASEERLRFALEGGEIGTWDFDIASGKIVWSERCKIMAGLAPKDETNYTDFINAIHPEDRAQINTAVERSLANREDYDVETRIIRKDGAVRWIRSIGRAYHDGQGRPVRMAGVAFDITDRKLAEQQKERLLERERAAREEAERANRIKDEFLAVLSHELRSPLNPILGWTKLLRSRKLDEQASERALETIERNAKLQTQLIEDLLDVSRILRGKLVLNASPVNLITVIQGALETVRLAAQAKHIEIQTILDSELGRVIGDGNRLQQVVWNLLSNAIKFTPPGGTVEVRLEQVDNYAQIQVKDNGKGISPQFLPHVFEYFLQEDSQTTRKFGGLGLGLAIVRHLTELQGGTVFAESPGENLGATFTVRLPLLEDTQELYDSCKDALLHVSTTHQLPLSGLQILVVDDEADMRELVVAILTQSGAEVKVVASAVEALLALDDFKADILVSDIGMPQIDGYMLMRQVRNRSPEQGGQIPAIALTAYAGEINQQQALAAGFQQHISKPVDPEELVQAIALLVGKV
ncbi:MULTISPECIES: ATP-binding protein [Nostocales]|uniref:ATP-binding protein n=1 Tax=Nostocales TaxID=1161 RepID=UPI0038B4AAA9